MALYLRMRMDISPGSATPLGATLGPGGVNFALRSPVATRVEVCLFAPEAPLRELARLTLPRCTEGVWHGHVSGLSAGLLYGFRVHGPWQPALGHRCNPAKLLLDPYARALTGEVQWNDATCGARERADAVSLARDASDSGPFVPRSVIVDPRFDWEGDRPLDTPWAETVIYEAHLRGFSKRHPGVPEALRGTYGGLAHEASIEHLVQLGVSAVELLPIHEMADDSFLVARGLRNYWGYSPLLYFAPAHRYAQSRAPGAAVVEFKQMVKTLHRAGIEVILDVVYNHTCEGHADGPTLCLKGIDNAGYYMLRPDGSYRDVSGCGNSLDPQKPATAQLILESLRYWVEELHVDGFRFDLATTLARTQDGEFAADGGLLRQVADDPVLSRCKLIAEPWDLGPDGYRVGQFPTPMREWNDKYRDTVRRLWRGVETRPRELADRLCGSPDVYSARDRSAHASINFVTAHDGFTLHDLVSYEQKHNEANGEQNRDGSDHNESCNHGIEGESAREDIVQQRAQHQRNLLATLFLSQGVPMLLGGDELDRTQGGNNNAYCQDNETSWLDFQLALHQRALLSFCRELSALRARAPALRQARFLRGERTGSDAGCSFLHADGSPLSASDWEERSVRALCWWLAGSDEPHGSALLVLLNPTDTPTTFTLPLLDSARRWQLALHTCVHGEPQLVQLDGRTTLELSSCMLAVLEPQARSSSSALESAREGQT
ncbi:MAG: hypothetical protein JWN48_824 [Myxococcaceae bacterium]|nr:hypothetical protein [Myxococcaceae bacterium]